MEVVMRSPAQAVQMLIMESIRREDAVLNQLASQALVAIGPDVVHTLVMDLVTTRNTSYQLRLIAEIGAVSDPMEHLELFNLSRNKSAAVREAAARTIWAVGPHSEQRTAAAAVGVGGVVDPV
jgi:hypothetical protein